MNRRPEENRLLPDIVEDESLTELEREEARKEMYRRVDEMIAESEGRKPHPNQTVWDMIEEHKRLQIAKEDFLEIRRNEKK